MLEIMRCLDDELKQVPAPDLKAYRVLRVLLDASIKALEKGNLDPQAFDRPSLLGLCETKTEAAKRIPGRWLTLGMLETFLDARKTAILGRIERAGLSQMPVISTNDDGGGSGNQRLFWLSTRPIKSSDLVQTATLAKQVVYTRTETGEVRPSWLLRLIFKSGELKNRSRRGLSLLMLVLAGMFFLLLWLIGGLWGVGALDQALTFRQRCVALFMLGCAWFVWQSAYLPWLRHPFMTSIN